MSTSTLTSKGQTTIPKDVRKRLNLHPGDRLEFVIDEDGRVLVLPASIDASELAGMLKPPDRRVTVEDMNRAIRKRGGRRVSVLVRMSWCDTSSRTILASRVKLHRSSPGNVHVTTPDSSIGSSSANSYGYWKVPMAIPKTRLGPCLKSYYEPVNSRLKICRPHGLLSGCTRKEELTLPIVC